MENKFSKLGIISLVLSIIGIFGGFLTYILVMKVWGILGWGLMGFCISFFCGVAAIILGIIANGLKGKGVINKYAIIIGIISIPINIFLLLRLLAVALSNML